jgi:hypothetical protein
VASVTTSPRTLSVQSLTSCSLFRIQVTAVVIISKIRFMYIFERKRYAI